MKKFLLFVLIVCMLAGNATVYAKETIHETGTISPEETKVVAIPEGSSRYGEEYFVQDFEFTAQESGIYRFLVSYEEDKSQPYNFYLVAHRWSDLSFENGGKPESHPDSIWSKFQSFDYRSLPNCIEFDGFAGETYRLRFVYPDNDKRYPEFTFRLERGDHPYREETISYGETKVFTVPQPEGEVDPELTYFTQDFVFVPEKSRTCRILFSYEEDESNPYRFSLEDYLHSNRPLRSGDEIEVLAGKPCRLRFQYPIHDGRYPEFTIRITHNREPIQAGMILYPGIVILACVIAVKPSIRLRKKNQ